MKPIGPTFFSELQEAGLIGLPFSWGDDGDIQFRQDMTPEQIAGVMKVYEAHDPAKQIAPTAKPISDGELAGVLLSKGLLTNADLEPS